MFRHDSDEVNARALQALKESRTLIAESKRLLALLSRGTPPAATPQDTAGTPHHKDRPQ